MRIRAGGGRKRRPGHYCLTHLAHITIMLTVEKTTGLNDWKIFWQGKYPEVEGTERGV